MGKTLIKISALMCCTVLIFAMLAGCGSKQGTDQTSQSSTTQSATASTTASTTTPAEKITLTLNYDNTSDQKGLKAVTDFIEQKLNIATTLDIRPGGSEGDNVVLTRLAAGDCDDLIYYNSGSLFNALHPEANLVDLTNEPFMANVLDSFKSTVTSNGKVFGIPSGASQAGGWFYNKKVYTELGLSVPKTWDELLANCEKIKAAGKTAVIGSYKDSWSAQLILLADYYNVQAAAPSFAADFTANKAKFATTPAALRSFEKLQEVYKKGYLNKDYLSTTYQAALKMLADGTGVQYPMLTGVLPVFAQSYPDTVNDIGVFAQPSDSADINGLTVWMPPAFFIYNNSKNIDAAKMWAEAFISPEGIAAYATQVKATGPYVIQGAALPDDAYAGVKEMLPLFNNGKTAPALEFITPVKGPNLPQISVECGAGMKSPLECAKEYDKDVEKQAKQLNLAGW